MKFVAIRNRGKFILIHSRTTDYYPRKIMKFTAPGGFHAEYDGDQYEIVHEHWYEHLKSLHRKTVSK